MGLADAVRPDEAQAFGAGGKILGEAANRGYRVDQFLVGIDLEIVEVAAAIARWDARVFEQAPRVLILPALATHDSPHAADLNRLPTGIVAGGTHGKGNAECRMLNAEVKDEL